ncbi:MAG: 6,7-dimethyl-8-ribityllumazine synthase [Dehalococcoidia bacterium]
MPYTVGDGDMDVTGLRVAVVVSMFNDQVTRKMLDGALQTAREMHIEDDDIEVYWVPGAFELAVVAERVAGTGMVDAVAALGCIIRGETPHFDFVAAETARGIMQSGLTTGVPVSLGVLTTDDLGQAQARAGGAAGNKGSEAMYAALHTAAVLGEIDGRMGMLEELSEDPDAFTALLDEIEEEASDETPR